MRCLGMPVVPPVSKMLKGRPLNFLGTQTSGCKSRSHSSWKCGNRCQVGEAFDLGGGIPAGLFGPVQPEGSSRSRAKNAIARFRGRGRRAGPGRLGWILGSVDILGGGTGVVQNICRWWPGWADGWPRENSSTQRIGAEHHRHDGHVAVAEGHVAGGIEEKDLDGAVVRRSARECRPALWVGLHQGGPNEEARPTNKVAASAPHLVLRFQNSAATMTGDMAAKPEKA